VEHFKYLGTNLKNQNYIEEEIKSIIKSGNACSHSVQNLLSSVCCPNFKVETYGTIILSAVLYGNETWSFTLREEGRLRVSENRVSRRIFEPKRDEVTGKWRKLCNEELNVLYSSPSTLQEIKSRRMKWLGYVAGMEERRDVYWVTETTWKTQA
jgi:hypothetical protein